MGGPVMAHPAGTCSNCDRMRRNRAKWRAKQEHRDDCGCPECKPDEQGCNCCHKGRHEEHDYVDEDWEAAQEDKGDARRKGED